MEIRYSWLRFCEASSRARYTLRAAASGSPVRTTLVSAVVQVLAVHAHEHLLKDYYEVALKSKYAQDKYSAEMLDLVVAGITAPFEFAYELGFGSDSYLGNITFGPVSDSISQGTDVTASSFATKTKVANKRIAKLIEAYTNGG